MVVAFSAEVQCFVLRSHHASFVSVSPHTDSEPFLESTIGLIVIIAASVAVLIVLLVLITTIVVVHMKKGRRSRALSSKDNTVDIHTHLNSVHTPTYALA